MTLFFPELNFILHLLHHFANFRRSLRKCSAANCTFFLAAYGGVSLANWDFKFCLW